MDIEKLKYPIGRFKMPSEFSTAEIEGWIKDITELPEKFSTMALSLTDGQLDTPYRPGGWTGRQVIHHLPDSHLNAYCRFKWVLTEDSPEIKPYFEDRWAELADTTQTPIETSLQLLTALHERWSILLGTMSQSDFKKYYVNPEYGKKYALGAVCKLYAWHGNHHLGHLGLLQ